MTTYIVGHSLVAPQWGTYNEYPYESLNGEISVYVDYTLLPGAMNSMNIVCFHEERRKLSKHNWAST